PRRGGGRAAWPAPTAPGATPTPYPTVATPSPLTHSPSNKNIRNIIDGADPRASNDSTSYFDWWPRNGCAPGAAPLAPPSGQGQRPRCSDGEWIEMTFAKPSTVLETQIYWFDDTGRGGVRVPATWKLLYKDGAEWTPVETSGPYGVAKDQYNVVRFKPVTTSALRLELVMQPNVSAGVQEWKVK